jgi:hypothetical protein
MNEFIIFIILSLVLQDVYIFIWSYTNVLLLFDILFREKLLNQLVIDDMRRCYLFEFNWPW